MKSRVSRLNQVYVRTLRTPDRGLLSSLERRSSGERDERQPAAWERCRRAYAQTWSNGFDTCSISAQTVKARRSRVYLVTLGTTIAPQK